MSRLLLVLCCTSTLAASARAQGPDGGIASLSDAARPEDAGPRAIELTVPADHEPDLDVVVAPESGLVTGDLVTIEITAQAADGDELRLPEQAFDPFDVRSTTRETPSAENQQRFVFRIELLALRPGTHSVGPIEIQVIDDGINLGRIRTEPLSLEVASVLGNEPNAEPKPPTQPVQVLEEDYTLAWIGGALLALLLTAVATWFVARWWSRRPKAAPPPPPPRPADEVAYEKLTELRQKLPGMWQEGKIVEWVDDVNDALREYLGARFGFEGLESTTDEILARLRKARLPSFVHNEITIHLGESDLIKFAKASPDEASCERLISGAVRIVQQTSVTHAPVIVATPPISTPPPSQPTSTPPGGSP